MEAVQVMNQLRHIKSYVRLVYKYCVESANPKFLIKKELQKQGEKLLIRGSEYGLNNNCYVVGFGKAVLDMAIASEEILGEHIVGGALSVPYGLISQTNTIMPKKIEVYEGAEGNIPDIKALETSKKIVELIEPLKEEDLLLVLVSGGGSALLPYPYPPVTLEEKIFITNKLARAGADIMELNAVRKRLSLLKGGRLIKLAHPAKVVALVLSDVLNDSLDVIASGPTVPDRMPTSLAIDVLKKYDLERSVPSHVMDVLKKTEQDQSYFSNTVTHVIGNNKSALIGGEEFTAKDGYVSKIMTCSLKGDVSNVAVSLAKLASLICQALGKTISSKLFIIELEKLCHDLCFAKFDTEDLTRQIFEPSSKNKVCLLFGGETTVKITGSGTGGRNQELALRFSLALDEFSKTLHVMDLFNIVMLCGGTDGIDGPTDAAGAIAYNGQCQHALIQKLDAQKYISNNNSYGFYSTMSNGEDLLKIGMTGTNVMDINVLTIQAKM